VATTKKILEHFAPPFNLQMYVTRKYCAVCPEARQLTATAEIQAWAHGLMTLCRWTLLTITRGRSLLCQHD